MSNIYVALSGGVDSSVALALLQEQGHSVTGVYFKTYKPDGDKEYCKQQGMDAQAVCEHLGVPFKVYDLESEYKERVFDYMIKGYRAGVTPNPDIVCNREIKFGVFAERAFAEGADMIATGHYANILQREPLNMTMAKDENKDQTYFLSQVSSDVLAKTIFPLGGFVKSDVREMAQERGLHTASKKDSQGICFIGQEIDVKSFLKRYIPEERGEVLSVDGVVIGTHNGASYSTVGERHGFTIAPEHKSTEMPRLFVISRDIKANTITVGTKEQLSEYTNNRKCITIADCNWIGQEPVAGVEYKCRIRHRGELYPCKVRHQQGGQWEIDFVESPYAPAAGQYAALYAGRECLGGGVML